MISLLDVYSVFRRFECLFCVVVYDRRRNWPGNARSRTVRSRPTTWYSTATGVSTGSTVAALYCYFFWHDWRLPQCASYCPSKPYFFPLSLIFLRVRYVGRFIWLTVRLVDQLIDWSIDWLYKLWRIFSSNYVCYRCHVVLFQSNGSIIDLNGSTNRFRMTRLGLPVTVPPISESPPPPPARRPLLRDPTFEAPPPESTLMLENPHDRFDRNHQLYGRPEEPIRIAMPESAPPPKPQRQPDLLQYLTRWKGFVPKPRPDFFTGSSPRHKSLRKIWCSQWSSD